MHVLNRNQNENLICQKHVEESFLLMERNYYDSGITTFYNRGEWKGLECKKKFLTSDQKYKWDGDHGFGFREDRKNNKILCVQTLISCCQRNNIWSHGNDRLLINTDKDHLPVSINNINVKTIASPSAFSRNTHTDCDHQKQSIHYRQIYFYIPLVWIRSHFQLQGIWEFISFFLASLVVRTTWNDWVDLQL